MKITLENIFPAKRNSSFNWLINPKLNDFYIWHFHPEYELVLIEAKQGTRHVGDHIGKFKDFDLVLIGSNIPHLNFDYGIKTAYEKTVLHMHPQFLENATATLELASIVQLMEKSRFGLVFGTKSFKKISHLFKKAHRLSSFEQFLEVLKNLKILAETKDYKQIHKKEPTNLYNKKETDRLTRINHYIKENYTQKITLNKVAGIAHLNNAAFCRYFKKMTKLTFVEYLNHFRINEAKRLLLTDNNVSQTCYACGFESLSYFNRTFKKVTGENPLHYKQRMST